jgi:hypothetical protein
VTAQADDAMDPTDRDETAMHDSSESPAFRRSSFCCTGECVAVAFIPGGVLVRHHRGPGPTLEFNFSEWRVFVDAVKAGEFDTPGSTTAVS